MKTTTEVFEVGQQVQWSPRALTDITFRRDHEGPFVVVEVHEVPDKCSCGVEFDDPEHKGYVEYIGQCPAAWLLPDRYSGRPLRDQVGHDQWLIVRPANSEEALQCSPLTGGGPAKFSGAWFAPVS